MGKTIGAIDALTAIALQAVKEVLEANTKIPVKASSTIQKVPKVSVKPEIGCFVPFTGDYSGLVVMNFSAGAAMLLYRSYMMTMGLPEEELAKEYTNSINNERFYFEMAMETAEFIQSEGQNCQCLKCAKVH